MAIFRCFCVPSGRSRNSIKGKRNSTETLGAIKNLRALPVKSRPRTNSIKTNDLVATSLVIPGSKKGKVKVMNHESPVEGEFDELAYEGSDEHDESLSMKRDNSDIDLQACEEVEHGIPIDKGVDLYEPFEANSKSKKTEMDIEMNGSGHISDPGFVKAEFWASPKLTRSCSDLAMSQMFKKIGDDLPLPKSQSFEDMQRLGERLRDYAHSKITASPGSLISHHSADKVMLKKHSSSQILPSRSQKLWWKLFLWSHRNLHGAGHAKSHPNLAKIASNQQGGYSSDTLQPRSMELSNMESPCSFTEQSPKRMSYNDDHHRWDGLAGVSGLWPQNQWVAFPADSCTLTRVDQWVNELPEHASSMLYRDGDTQDDIFPASPDDGRPPPITSSSSPLCPHDDFLNANAVIQSLNSSSTVAHIAGIGLKVIPNMPHLSVLRSVNLSGNFIVHVSPGSLPKGLHTLNLSKNKINTIEGLRELTRLRVLDLSYNRISRIGQGLSNCTLIKELYLAGNKISDVEGLHRLSKLAILDLCFNKITTTKSLGQLVANYNSLLALNLLGNPIQNNISDEQLRKTVCSLLPKLAFLNKQPINIRKARELGSQALAKAALRNCSSSNHRRTVKRLNLGSPSFSSVHRTTGNVIRKSRHKSESRNHRRVSSRTKSSALASSSR